MRLPSTSACAGGSSPVADFGQVLYAYIANDGVDSYTVIADDGMFAFEAGEPNFATHSFWHAVQDGNGTWVMSASQGAGPDTLFRSTDGRVWTDQAAPFLAYTLRWANTFLAIGATFEEVATSPTGEVWTEQTSLPLAGFPSHATYGRGRIVVAGVDGVALVGMYSDDGGASWTEITFPSLGRDVYSVNAFVFDEQRKSWRLYIDDDSPTFTGVLTSSDGAAWEDASASLGFPDAMQVVVCSATGRYYAQSFVPGVSMSIVTSTDGLSFAPAFDAPALSLSSRALQTNQAGKWLLTYGDSGHSKLVVWDDGAPAYTEIAQNLDEFPGASGGGILIDLIAAPVPLQSAAACAAATRPLRIRIA